MREQVRLSSACVNLRRLTYMHALAVPCHNKSFTHFMTALLPSAGAKSDLGDMLAILRV